MKQHRVRNTVDFTSYGSPVRWKDDFRGRNRLRTVNFARRYLKPKHSLHSFFLQRAHIWSQNAKSSIVGVETR
jgi:hypothetical protein